MAGKPLHQIAVQSPATWERKVGGKVRGKTKKEIWNSNYHTIVVVVRRNYVVVRKGPDLTKTWDLLLL